MTFLPNIRATLVRFAASVTMLMALALSAVSAEAEPRIALIVGNGAYASVTTLENPVPDAELMAQVLRDKGFEVTMLVDADQVTLNRGIAQFGRELRAAGSEATGLFYYAGHAVQSFGSNFLIPTDASLTDAADLSLVAVPAQAVLRQMFSANNKTNIMILDACRNNPFEAIPDLNDNGLAEMKAPTGTLVSYSTAPGAVALDGTGSNSPFTTALARQIPTPGLAVEQVFKNVRVDVIKETNGQQTPWETSSLTGDFVFEAKAKLTPEQLAERQTWNSVRFSRDPVPVLLFMRAYPNSVHIDEARALLAGIIDSELAAPVEPAVVATVPTPTPAPEVVPTPAPTPAPATAETFASEQEAILQAQQSGTAVDYQAYLDAFPNGTYAELAQFELTILATKTAAPEPDQQIAAVVPLEQDKPLTFRSLLITGGDRIAGQTIENVIAGSPAFPPFEGLPEELWKGQTCSNCHEWTKEALCTQGKTYISAANADALTKQHPFGGGFKIHLRDWADTGCQ